MRLGFDIHAERAGRDGFSMETKGEEMNRRIVLFVLAGVVIMGSAFGQTTAGGGNGSGNNLNGSGTGNVRKGF